MRISLPHRPTLPGAPQMAELRRSALRETARADLVRVVGRDPLGGALGDVERNVCMPHECLAIAAVFGAGRDPDAALGRKAKSLGNQWRVEGVLQASSNPNRLAQVSRGKDKGKLVTAPARKSVDLAQDGPELVGKVTKDEIADLMAQCVVDDLEVIEIEHHDAKWDLFATVCRQGHLQAVVEQGAVWHSGQGIVERLMPEAQSFFVEQLPKPMDLLVIVADQPHDAGIGAGADHVEARCQYLIGGPQFEGKGADELHCCIPPVQVMLGDGKDREPGCGSNPSLLADPVRFFLGG